jgi:hypothetical protein
MLTRGKCVCMCVCVCFCVSVCVCGHHLFCLCAVMLRVREWDICGSEEMKK